MANSNYLATEKISRLLFKFSVPTFLTLLVNQLYNLIDQIFIGQGIGIVGIAAANVAFPFFTICSALALWIGDGCSANISLFSGKGEHENADKVFTAAVSLLLGTGFAFVFISQLFLQPLVLLFGASPTALEAAMAYSRIILLGLPFMMCSIAFTAIIRADGNPQYMMRCMILGAVINLFLDPLFIFVFKLGVEGAAAATVIGQVASGTLSLMYIPKFKTVQWKKEYALPRFNVSKQILAFGFPSLMTQLCATLTQIVMNNLMRSCGALTDYGSDIAISSYGIMMKLYQIAHSMFVGVSSGTQPINGFNYGAKLYKRVYTTYKTAACVSIVISAVWFLLFRFCGNPIAACFISGDPLFHEFAVHCFKVYMLAFFLYGMPMVTASFFQAVGMPRKALLITVSRQLFFLIPFALMLSHFYGMDGALAAAPVADILTFIVSLAIIFTEFSHWKKANLI
ncbi:MAG: MATE family efflux transporter [Oscillospiraceae bacterium]|nr:MATE family efflux transporter [Oscillospiraceae bacterium]